jgi:hypothetical protein
MFNGLTLAVALILVQGIQIVSLHFGFYLVTRAGCKVLVGRRGERGEGGGGGERREGRERERERGEGRGKEEGGESSVPYINFLIQLRGAVIGTCYRKVMALPVAKPEIVSQAITIITQDGQRIFLAILFFHQMWSVPVFGVSTFLTFFVSEHGKREEGRGKREEGRGKRKEVFIFPNILISTKTCSSHSLFSCRGDLDRPIKVSLDPRAPRDRHRRLSPN